MGDYLMDFIQVTLVIWRNKVIYSLSHKVNAISIAAMEDFSEYVMILWSVAH